MKTPIQKSRILTTFIIMIFSISCSSTIENKSDINEIQFTIGKTSKQDVSNALGLPSKIHENKKTKKTYWAYTEKSKLIGIQIAIPDATTTSATIHEVPSFSAGMPANTAIIYVFNENGILENTIRPGDKDDQDY